MIKKLLRRLGVLLAVILLVPVVVALLGLFLIPKDKVRDQVAEKLAAATGAQVELGQPSVRVWPGLGVSLQGGTIAGTGAALAAATGSSNHLQDYLVQLDGVEVRVELRPLLHKNISISEVKISGPLLEVSWDQDRLIAREFQLDVSDLGLPLEAARNAGTVAGETPVGEMIPEDLSLRFAGEIKQLVLQGAAYDQVVFAGDLDARLLTFESLTGLRSGGTFSAEGEVDFERDPHGELDFQAQVLAVPAPALLQPWVPDLAQRLTGDLDGEVSGTCNLEDKETALASLSLNGQLGCGEGVLDATDWLQDVSPYLGPRQDLKVIRFRSLEHHFRIDEGRYHLEDLELDGQDTHWQGQGWIGLKGTLDASLLVKLPEGFTPDLGQWSFLADTLRDPDGRVNLSLRFTGRTEKPRVGVDLGNLQGAGDQGATDAAKKGLGGLLDKWKTR